LVREEVIKAHPFDKMNIAPAPKKVILAFSHLQIKRFFSVIDTKTPVGKRNYVGSSLC
jgi:hypothetical protein